VTALLGLGTHFVIATVMAAVFVLGARRLTALNRNSVMWGLIYGLVLYVVMNYVVLPLSAAHRSQHFATDLQEVATRLQVSFSSLRPKNGWLLAGTLFTHTLLVGLQISLVNKRIVQAGSSGPVCGAPNLDDALHDAAAGAVAQRSLISESSHESPDSLVGSLGAECVGLGRPAGAGAKRSTCREPHNGRHRPRSDAGSPP
jgi:hypothetical protein